MKPILTLTLNPSIDGSCEAEKVQPIHKVRTSNERYDPGGGGINVARVIRTLGGQALAVYLAGGMTGNALDRMIDDVGLPHLVIPIAGDTRVSHVVYERSTGLEYRLTPSGPPVTEAELENCLRTIKALHCDYLVASGSLAPGSPEDFYGRLGRVAKGEGSRLVVDTSGPALRAALDEGVFLVKPSVGELESAVGRKLREPGAVEEAARDLVARGAAEVVTVTLGADGALLVTAEKTLRLRSPDVEVKSAVGAGDSFVAAMTLGLAQERPVEQAFAYAVACGAATAMTAGTELCHRNDVERLYGEVKKAMGVASLSRAGR